MQKSTTRRAVVTSLAAAPADNDPNEAVDRLWRDRQANVEQANHVQDEEASDDLYRMRVAIIDRIRDEEPCFNAVAALHLVTISYWGHDRDLLRHIRPGLTGLVAEHVDMVLAENWNRPADLSF